MHHLWLKIFSLTFFLTIFWPGVLDLVDKRPKLRVKLVFCFARLHSHFTRVLPPSFEPTQRPDWWPRFKARLMRKELHVAPTPNVNDNGCACSRIQDKLLVISCRDEIHLLCTQVNPVNKTGLTYISQCCFFSYFLRVCWSETDYND